MSDRRVEGLERRRWRLAITVAVTTVLLVPIALDHNGFPLSTYPMYSSARGDTTRFTLANGLASTGDRERLSLDLIGRSDDPLIVAGELRAAVREERALERCRAIAERVAASDREDLVAVEIVSETHRVVDATKGAASLVERTEHESCPVLR